MDAKDIAKIEDQLKIKLPGPYRDALLESGLKGDPYQNHPEFLDDVDYLNNENQHLLDNLSAPVFPNTQTLAGRLKKFWRTISGAEKRARLAYEWYELWTVGRRFYIGSDLGEEMYFIVLTEPDPAVYCYCFELEASNSRVVAKSIPDWIVEVKRLMREAEKNP